MKALVLEEGLDCALCPVPLPAGLLMGCTASCVRWLGAPLGIQQKWGYALVSPPELNRKDSSTAFLMLFVCGLDSS